jgi:Histidine kinase/Histidine kinase-, DNA gyrase B-, and HSP90-like ATPase
MILISVVFLFVNLFGAYAYGTATLYSIRKVSPIWSSPHRQDAAGGGQDRPALALFALSTVWFVVNTLIVFRYLTGDAARDDILDLATLLVYLFPPVIMHTVYQESTCDGEPAPPPIFRHGLRAMYVIGPVFMVTTVAMIFQLLPRPENFGAWIGGSIGGLFTLASMYSTVLMLRRKHRTRTADQLRLRNVMIFLFIGLSGVFVALIFMQEQGLLLAILEHVTRASPLYFLIASVYFENRFEFYDLVVKRALMLLISVFVLGVYFSIVLPSLELLPGGAARPWLFAVALVPIAMVMPLILSRSERWLDRIWLGREFTPVEAVKHVLAAMQPAIDEASLVAAAEARLSEIFGAKIAILVGSRAIFEPSVQMDIKLTSPVSGAVVRIVVLKEDRTRRFLSEDLTLLRSLGGVFGFMLENIRLHRKRLEQEQLAQELRLQSSKSELKALRAQINPHFLFNALNAIASLIHTDPARADEVVEQLAEVFRYTLRRSDSEWAPLDQELAFARAYLDVEQARFGQRLSFAIDSDHTLPAPQIPSMLLQTLLENAVKHGVSQAREPGRIDVVVRTTPDQVTVEVRNTGPAHSTRDSAVARSRSTHGSNDAVVRSGQAGQAAPDGEGFGLHSVKERLKGHFGDRASFRLTRDEGAGVTVAHIAMPNVMVAA